MVSTHVLAALSILTLTSAAVLDTSLQKRDQVGDCKGALVALKATLFCSSFLHLHDVTSTFTVGGTTQTTTTTVSAGACPVTAAGNTVTTVQTATVAGSTVTRTTTLVQATTTVTTTGSQPVTTVTITGSSNTITTAATQTIIATTSQTTTVTASSLAPYKKRSPAASGVSCSIQGVPVAINYFVCDIISSACSQYVSPRTASITQTASAKTITLTVTGPSSCTTVTSAGKTVTNTVTTTNVASTITQTITPAPSTVTFTTTPLTTTVAVTTTPPAVTTTSTTTTSTTTTTTATVYVCAQGYTADASGNCVMNPRGPYCGDGILQGNEQCDSGDGCLPNCTCDADNCYEAVGGVACGFVC